VDNQNVVQQNPNATFVLASTPVTTLIVWVALRLGLVMPQYVAAAVATVAASGLLIFRLGIQKAGRAVWTFGLTGCCRRLWKGAPPS
jgi:hypothetical protein